MLTPDIDSTKQQLAANAANATAVTDYAQAAITAVPRLRDPPDWFVPLATDLATAKTHAAGWLKVICPLVSSRIPEGIKDFSALFAKQAGRILALQEQIAATAEGPTGDQRAEVDSLIGSLAAGVDSQEAAVTSTQQKVTGYLADLEADQDALHAALGTVSERFATGGTWITQLTDTLGEKFVDAQVLGPCTAIVEINLDISLRINGIGADPTVLTLVVAKAILDAQVDNSTSAGLAVESLLGTWTTLKAKADAVRVDLGDAGADTYLAVLSELDMKVARDQWEQLAQYASSLISGSSLAAPPSSTID